MSRAEWNNDFNEKQYITNAKKLFAMHNAEDKYETFFAARRDSEIFNRVARLVRGTKLKYTEFKQLFGTCARDFTNQGMDDILAHQPLMMLGDTPETIKIYPNIILDTSFEEDIGSVCWLLALHVLDTFWKDLHVPNNGAYKPTDDQLWARYSKLEEVPTAKAFARYTNLGKHVTADKLRDLAVAFEEQRKPMELKFADKPEDYITMYTTGPQSCMGCANGGDGRTWKWLVQAGFHPCSFFYYHPYTRGVYTTARGNVVGRSILYQYEDGSWYYGRVYAANPKYQEAFERTLRTAGYKWTGDHTHNKYARKCTFEIPGIKSAAGVYSFPAPFCDNLANSIYAEWSEFDKKFIITCNGKESANVSHQHQSGYILSTALKNAKCCQCGTVCREKTHHAQDGRIFCSVGCYTKQGLISAIRGDGVELLVHQHDVYRDPMVGNYFTNREACVQRGGHPIMHEYGDIDENDEVTVHGTIILFKGQLYRAHFSINDDIYRGIFKVYGNAPTGEKIYVKPDDLNMLPMITAKITIHTQKVVIIEENERLVA